MQRQMGEHPLFAFLSTPAAPLQAAATDAVTDIVAGILLMHKIEQRRDDKRSGRDSV